MANTSMRLLYNNQNSAMAKFIHNKKVSGGTYILTKSTPTNIYATASLALNNSVTGDNSNVMMQVRGGYAARVSEKYSSNNSKYALKIRCGSKDGWVYIGAIEVRDNGQTYIWTEGNYISVGITDDRLDDAGKGNYSSAGTYKSLNSSPTTVDKVAIMKINEENNAAAEDNEDAKSSSTASGISSSNNNANSGEINVTYEYAVKVSPYTYIYNMADYTKNNSYENYASSNSIQKGIDYSKLRFVFGIPYQYLPTTDCRVGNNYTTSLEQTGYEFAEKIVSRMPLLYITPGNTSFMGGTTENYRTALIGSLGDRAPGAASAEDALTESSLETMLGEYNGKLYTIMPAYTEYFKYVNPLCRAGAIFLDISEKSFDSEDGSGSDKFGNFNWGINEGIAYEIWEDEEDTEDEEVEDGEKDSDNKEQNDEKADKDEKSDEDKTDSTDEDKKEDEEETEPKKAKFEEDYSEFFTSSFSKLSETISDFESRLYYGNAIAFYINSDSSFTDSFGNETTESSLSTTINTLSDKAREIQFLLGTSRQAVGEAFDKVDGTLSPIKDQINSIVEKVAGGNSIFTTIANSVKTIVSGGRMLFPQIWSNSSFSKSYNISIKLTTPNTDKISWWYNIYVPLCHLMALVLPRSEYVNSYTTPFLVKAFYKGMFNIDMGIITEMTFNKGKEGSWTKDGLPTVVDVTFSIQDLYSTMGMTSTESMFKGKTLQNVSEMDYIANLCGININEPDIFRMIRLWCAFNIENRVYDFIPNLELGVEKYLHNRVLNVYNNFWF